MNIKKTLILASALLTSFSALADISVSLQFINTIFIPEANESYTQELMFAIEFDGIATLTGEGYKIEVLATNITDKGATLTLKWFEQDDAGALEIVCQPTLTVTWNQEATIRIGEKNTQGQELYSREISIIAQKIDDTKKEDIEKENTEKEDIETITATEATELEIKN